MKFAHSAQVAEEKLLVAEDTVNRLRSSIAVLNKKYKLSQNEVEKMRHDYGIKLEKSWHRDNKFESKVVSRGTVVKNAKAEMLHDAEISMIEHTRNTNLSCSKKASEH